MHEIYGLLQIFHLLILGGTIANIHHMNPKLNLVPSSKFKLSACHMSDTSINFTKVGLLTIQCPLVFFHSLLRTPGGWTE